MFEIFWQIEHLTTFTEQLRRDAGCVHLACVPQHTKRSWNNYSMAQKLKLFQMFFPIGSLLNRKQHFVETKILRFVLRNVKYLWSSRHSSAVNSVAKLKLMKVTPTGRNFLSRWIINETGFCSAWISVHLPDEPSGLPVTNTDSIKDSFESHIIIFAFDTNSQLPGS